MESTHAKKPNEHSMMLEVGQCQTILELLAKAATQVRGGPWACGPRTKKHVLPNMVVLLSSN